jgi:crossover junction endodeoxyribonuclease RuvC
MVILGFDPGLRLLGWGVIEDERRKLRYVASGTIKIDHTQPLADRLGVIFSSAARLVRSYAPDECAVEETIVNMNLRTSLHLAHARAAVLCGIRAASAVPVAEYSPTQIKRFVHGGGAADKQAVQAAVSRLLPGCVTSGLDESDALACAITHALQPRGVAFSAKNLGALKLRGNRLVQAA